MSAAAASEEEGRRLIEAGFSDVLVEAASRCTTWIVWHVRASGAEREIVNNGTAFFLDAGKGAFGVTAAHVVAGLESDKLRHSGLICQVGHCLLDPSDRLIDRDDTLDIAVFRVSASEMREIGIDPHVAPTPWPPPTPQEGRGGFFGGYVSPPEKRFRLQETQDWSYQYGFGPITGVFDHQLTMRFQREDWVVRPDHPPPPPGAAWGGLSGGPLFALFENPVVYWRLVGVISEFPSRDIELMVVKPARRIRQDGSVSA
jgi:hypothetical protein